MAETPEESDYTSIQERIEAAKKGEGEIPKKLMRFQGAAKKDQAGGIPCALVDYIELVDTRGRLGW